MKREMKKEVFGLVLGFVAANMLLAGCGEKGTAAVDAGSYAVEVSQIEVDDDIRIVGLGEATHGNHEMQKLKLDVFKALVENEGCRIFAIEGDFGGCAKVNDYIAGGEGSAEDAAAEIGFAIYRTEEMAELIQWMREYNESAPEGEQLKFYGFDMQRFDNNKEYLFEYLDKVDGELAENYRALLADLNDETVYTQDKEKVKNALTAANELLGKMEENKDAFVAQTDEKQYEFALQCVHCICQNATLRGSGMNYSTLRDEYMKNRVEWIYQYEGGQLLFINGHNGHIEKTSKSGYTCMGEYLADSYGDAYYAIGMDVAKTTFRANSSSGESAVMTIENENNLTEAFKNTDRNISFMDFEKAGADSAVQQMLKSEADMLNIGAEFNSWQKTVKKFYSLSMIPEESYDAVIVIKEDQPSTLF